jgi:hypothetical protein
MSFKSLFLILCLMIVLTGCGSGAPATTAPPPTDLPVEEPTQAPTEPPVTEAPVTEPPATEPPVPPQKPLSGLSADPQRVEFQAEDGTKLVGYYYPSKYADAPIMILMHWAGGDLCDWKDIALWLQNRADENPAKLERCANAGANLPAGFATPWWDPTWFPAMAPDVSIAVFAFDFRGYGESDAGGFESTKDTKAAFVTAAGFEGVDTSRMAALGASIGADGAPDGCLLYNQEAGSGCVGAFSLSPGNYLGMLYAIVINDLTPLPVWCLAADGDTYSAPVCEGVGRENYRSLIYADTEAHGMSLISPAFEPQPMKLIQQFIGLAFGEVAEPE